MQIPLRKGREKATVGLLDHRHGGGPTLYSLYASRLHASYDDHWQASARRLAMFCPAPQRVTATRVEKSRTRYPDRFINRLLRPPNELLMTDRHTDS